MKMLLYIISLFSFVVEGKAHNFFSEGDAYISFEVDYRKYKAFKNNNNLKFNDIYGELLFKGDIKYMQKSMIAAYERYRSIHEAILEVKIQSLDDADIVKGRLLREKNPLHCFVYNRNYQIEKRLIGFKYNENWMVGNKKNKRFLLGEWMYSENYLFAKQVSGLKAQISPDKVSVKAEDVCVVMMSTDHLMRFKRKENMEGITITRITNNKVTVYELREEFGIYSFIPIPTIKESCEFGKAIELEFGEAIQETKK